MTIKLNQFHKAPCFLHRRNEGLPSSRDCQEKAIDGVKRSGDTGLVFFFVASYFYSPSTIDHETHYQVVEPSSGGWSSYHFSSEMDGRRRIFLGRSVEICIP